MRRLIGSAALASVLIAAAAEAALAPHYQREAELTRIITDDRVRAELQGATIDSVSVEGPDLYKVIGGFCVVMVRIVDLPPPGEGWAGPRRFDLDVSPARCR